MKIFLFTLLIFSIQKSPIDYFFSNEKSIIYVLYEDKIESYSIEDGVKLISSKKINPPSEFNLSNFSFVNEYMLSSDLGGSILKNDHDSIYRIDRSYEHRMQLESIQFIRNDTLFRYGGYGFFEDRNFFTYYDNRINGWEYLDINGDILPKRLSDFTYHINDQELTILGGYSMDKFKNGKKHKNFMGYVFDFKSKKWTVLGELKTHFERTTSLSLDDQKMYSFKGSNIYLLDFNKKVIEEFTFTPTIRKIKTSIFKPFINNNRIVYFQLEQGELKIQSISVDEFKSNLKKTDSYKFDSLNYLLIFLIIILILLGVLSYVIRKNLNKFKRIGNRYYFNFKKLNLVGKEEKVFEILFEYSNNQSFASNAIITELFHEPELHYGTVNRKKNELLNVLNNKLKIILNTNQTIIVKENSLIDRREIRYSLNKNFV